MPLDKGTTRKAVSSQELRAIGVMFDRVAVRAENLQVRDGIVLPITIAMVNNKDLRLGAIPAPRACAERVSSRKPVSRAGGPSRLSSPHQQTATLDTTDRLLITGSRRRSPEIDSADDAGLLNAAAIAKRLVVTASPAILGRRISTGQAMRKSKR